MSRCRSMRSATVSIDIDLVAETALVVAAKEDRIAARGIFFARVKDVLDDKIKFADGIVRRNSLDKFARRKPFAYNSCFCYNSKKVMVITMITIYKITNILNNKPYVGQTCQPIEKRFLQHSKANSPLGDAMRQCGLENFTIEVIETCETQT